jgi:hypothetical protein
VAPKSLATAPNTLVWLGADAVYTFGILAGVNPLEGGGFGRLSDDIEPMIDGMENKHTAVGAIFRNAYWLACDPDNTGANSVVMVYRFPVGNKPGAWTRYDYPLDITAFHVTRSDEYGLFAADRSGELVRLDFGYSDGGLPIAWHYLMPPLAPKSFDNVKNFRVMHLGTVADSPQSLTVSISTDDVSPPPQTATVTAQSGATPIRMLIPARGRYAQPRFSSTASNQDASVESMTISYVETPMR